MPTLGHFSSTRGAHTVTAHARRVTERLLRRVEEGGPLTDGDGLGLAVQCDDDVPVSVEEREGREGGE
jgi:hypothetical protein